MQDQQDQPDQQDQQELWYQQYHQDRTGLVLKRVLQHQQDQTMIQFPQLVLTKVLMKVQDQQDPRRARNSDPPIWAGPERPVTWFLPKVTCAKS